MRMPSPLDDLRRVWSSDHKLRESERAVLTVLALRRNGRTGQCNPGIRSIAADTGMTPLGVQRILGRLAAMGLIGRETAPGRSTRYSLDLEALEATLAPMDAEPVTTEGSQPVTTEGSQCEGAEVTTYDQVGDYPGIENRLPTVVKTALNCEGTALHGEEQPVKVRSANPYSTAFEHAWDLYPKRLGGNSKGEAWAAWRARIREGVTDADLTEGVSRYAAFIRATEKEHTPFVKQASAFFGPHKHWAEAWEYNPPRSGEPAMSASVAAGWAEVERQEREWEIQ